MKREELAISYLVELELILAFLFGVLVFSENCTPVRIAGVLLIAGGISCGQSPDSQVSHGV